MAPIPVDSMAIKMSNVMAQFVRVLIFGREKHVPSELHSFEAY